MSKALLPTGCYDILPPYARQESLLSSHLLSIFESYGYEQVSPPLLEYSDNLLSGRGAELSDQIFRVMDPAALKVMGIRSDMTMQIARIAASRLADAQRPLRLCYNGLIMRMKSEALKADRQLRQAGIELIGPSGADADAEVIMVAVDALSKSGINTLSIDLNLPCIVPLLIQDSGLDPDQLQNLWHAISHKDAAGVKRFDFRYRDSLVAIMQAVGDVDVSLLAIEKITLPAKAKAHIDELKKMLVILRHRCTHEWPMTLDITETRGLSYHSGVCFSIFVPGLSVEVGRGGRYRIESGKLSEDATGFTLYVETLRNLVPVAPSPKRVLLATTTAQKHADKLRSQGYVTIFALSEYDDMKQQAIALGCQAIYTNDGLTELSGMNT